MSCPVPATVCAEKEGATCKCKGNVTYGLAFAKGKPGAGNATTFEQATAKPFKSKLVKDTIVCSHAAMGGDPLPGFFKSCWCSPTAVSAGEKIKAAAASAKASAKAAAAKAKAASAETTLFSTQDVGLRDAKAKATAAEEDAKTAADVSSDIDDAEALYSAENVGMRGSSFFSVYGLGCASGFLMMSVVLAFSKMSQRVAPTESHRALSATLHSDVEEPIE